MNQPDPVNHPEHYTSHPSGVECIDITRHMPFNLGNVVKYLWRAGLKEGSPGVQDLRKAKWYLEDEIRRLENERAAPAHQAAFENAASHFGKTLKQKIGDLFPDPYLQEYQRLSKDNDAAVQLIEDDVNRPLEWAP